MSDYYIYHDQKRCIGCYACEVHCKAEHNVPVGPQFNAIIAVGPKLVDNVPRISFVYMLCYHCAKPVCVNVCPTGAMQKRGKDGIVFVEGALCIGCKSCITAFPGEFHSGIRGRAKSLNAIIVKTVSTRG